MSIPDDPIPRLKEQLRQEILALIGKWSQIVAADVLGVDQPRMSDLERGRLDRFSLEKLIRLLAHIDHRVELTVTPVGHQRLRIFRFRKS